MKLRPVVSVLFFAFLFFLFGRSDLYSAEEIEKVSLSVPKDFFSNVCENKIWSDVTVSWSGVKDKRSSSEVGVEKARGKDPVSLVASPELTVVFEENLKNLFQKCGMSFTSDGKGKAGIEISVEIEDFFVQVKRKRINDIGESKSRLVFIIKRPNGKKVVDIAYEKESEIGRRKPLKAFEQFLNELFLKTLEQVPKAKQLKQLS